MPLLRHDISDPSLEESIMNMLKSRGFAPSKQQDRLHLKGLGVGEGDSSVDLNINLVELDGHRILEFTCMVPTPPLTFDEAVLIAAHGNQSCLTVKFVPFENLDSASHQVKASLVIFADGINENELSGMIYIFVKEVDAIDNELVRMSREGK